VWGPKGGHHTICVALIRLSFAKVKDMIKDMDVGVLVNNVGVSYSFCRYFTELTMEEVCRPPPSLAEPKSWLVRVVDRWITWWTST
jgi:hypothetical protein